MSASAGKTESNASLVAMFIGGFIGAAGAFAFYLFAVEASKRFPKLPAPPGAFSGRRAAPGPHLTHEQSSLHTGTRPNPTPQPFAWQARVQPWW